MLVSLIVPALRMVKKNTTPHLTAALHKYKDRGINHSIVQNGIYKKFGN
jgi:hypothetical protein